MKFRTWTGSVQLHISPKENRRRYSFSLASMEIHRDGSGVHVKKVKIYLDLFCETWYNGRVIKNGDFGKGDMAIYG